MLGEQELREINIEAIMLAIGKENFIKNKKILLKYLNRNISVERLFINLCNEVSL